MVVWATMDSLSSTELGLEGAVAGGSLQVRVASEVRSIDENVWDSSLTGLGLKGTLEGGPLRDLVELNDLKSNSFAVEEVLRLVAEGAVRLRVHHDFVGGNLGVNAGGKVFSHLCC